MDELKIIDAKYRIKRLLGRGGFSSVYLVDGPEGSCALKLLQGEIAELKKSAIQEFKNEFSILKDMRHPNIASILDFGFDERTGRYYYTSEFIEGEDIVKATRGMGVEAITALFVQALRALGYLHSFRVYHFDVKAANLLVSGRPEPCVKMIDFGLAGIDPRGRLIGTPSYMPPEIVSRERADGRADLYSLGVLWYSCLARKNPFRAEESAETLSRQLKLVPPPPSSASPALPRWLDAIIMRLLEKNPADRFPNAATVIREINRQGGFDYPIETRQTLLSYLPDEGRFVGRGAEIDTLAAELEGFNASGQLFGGCLVEGEAGAGKTRLLKELKYRSQLKGVRFEWASAAEENDFRAWCDALSAHISGGNGLCAFVLDDAEAALGDQGRRASLLGLLSRARRPAAGAGAWIALSCMAAVSADLRAALLAMLPRRVLLRPFTRDEMSEYIISLTGLDAPPPLLLEGLFERTEGNPLFLTELIRSLIEAGALFDEHGRWNQAIFEDVGVDFSRAAMPRTLGALLTERSRSLPDEARALLEALAIAGRPSSAAELGAWSGVSRAGPVAMELVAQGILDRAEGYALRFHNALMPQALLEAMPQQRRSALHDRIAAHLKGSGAAEEEVLDHLSQGTEDGAALDAALALGERALRSGLGGRAAVYLGRALDRADPSDLERRSEIQMKLGEAYLIGHDYQAAMEHLSAVEATISASAGSSSMARWRAEALVRLGGTYIKLQNLERARAALHDGSRALADAGGDAALDLVIRNFLGSIIFMEGDASGARRIFEETAAAARALPESQAARVTNNDLGAALTALGELEDARGVLDGEMALAERLGDDLLIARGHYNLARLHTAAGDHASAAASYERCIETCRRSQNTELLLRAYNGMGNACRAAGDPDRSVAFYERGMALHEMTGDMRGGAAIAINIGLIESERSRFDAALDRIVPAVEYLRRLPDKTASDWAALSRGLLEQGDMARQAGRLDEARRILEEARGIAQETGQAAPQRFWILAALAEVARAAGRAGELDDLAGMMEDAASTAAERQALSRMKPEPAEGRDSGAATSATFRISERIAAVDRLVAAEDGPASALKGAVIDALLGAMEDVARSDFSRLVKEWRMPAGRPRGAGEGLAKEGGRALPASGMIDADNAYDGRKSWRDYERVIIARCLVANSFRVRPAARELGIAPATLYRKMRAFGLDQRSCAAYREPFAYARGARLRDYAPKIFEAALDAAGGRAREAIARLKVSQGHFYKTVGRKKNRGRLRAP